VKKSTKYHGVYLVAAAALLAALIPVTRAAAADHYCCATATRIQEEHRLAPEITPRGVGALRLGATVGALHRRQLIGGLRRGCELDPGQRVAPLRAPLAGWAIFANGRNRLSSIAIEGGAETARGIGIGSTAGEARRAYSSAEWISPRQAYPLQVGILWVNGSTHPKLTFLVDPSTHLIEAIAVPAPSFCE
jgi:hypothetical protein